MFKQILVPATGRESDAPVFAAALTVARLFDAHLEFLHVRQDPADAVVAASAGDMSGVATAALVEAVTESGARTEALARAAYEEFSAREKPDADFQLRLGMEATWLAAHGRTSDLVVTGRSRDGEEAAIGLLQEVLLGAGRPLLLVPEAPLDPGFGRVAIAWNDSPEAARAVAAALPFIERATEVMVLCAGDETAGDAFDDSQQRLLAGLRRHNPYVALRRVPQGGEKPVEVLLAACADMGAGLLVMGGYGHSVTRETLFGGFTQQVLTDAPLPVLIAH
ncbi:universal stress protein [Rhodovarius crocodyli]|nr:universal stress protein [Rhodovarius crocodyli]